MVPSCWETRHSCTIRRAVDKVLFARVTAEGVLYHGSRCGVKEKIDEVSTNGRARLPVPFSAITVPFSAKSAFSNQPV